jgi:hypothetical protein
MADIIDLALVSESKKHLSKLLSSRGLNYFLRADAKRPFQLCPDRVNLVVRSAAKVNTTKGRPPPDVAFEAARKEVRRVLIRQVVAQMLQTGL